MRTNLRPVLLVLMLLVLTASCASDSTSTGGGNGGGGGGGGGGGSGGGGGGGSGGGIQVTGVWEGTIQLTERVQVTVPKPPPTDFLGQTTTQDRACTLNGNLTLQLEQQGSGVSVNGDGSAEGGGCQRDGEASGSGTVTAGGRELGFTSLNLLGCTLAPFTATITGDNLAADVTGVAAAHPACRLVMGHLQLHRTG